MTLLRLPLDVLDNIVQATLPEGFEHLMMTCKALNQIGRPFLDEYNIFTRDWRHVDIAEQGSGVNDVADLLMRLIDDPRIGRYIRHACLWSDRPRDDDFYAKVPYKDDLDELWERQCDRKQVDAVDLKSLELLSASEAGSTAHWRAEELEAQRFLRTMILLLTIVPNIQTLNLPKEWKWCNRPPRTNDDQWNSAHQDIWGLLDELVTASNEDLTRRPFPSLKRLSYIESAGYDNGDSSLGFRCLMPFLAMPQLTELYASSLRLVDDGYTGVQFGDWRYLKYESNLQRIELANCCMDASIETFLSHVPNLQVFKYSHECKWHGCQYEWSAGEFVAAVGKCCGGSLVELAVTIDDRSIGCIMTGVTSLQEFKRLQHLELDTRVFAGPTIDSGERVFHTDRPEKIKWKVEQIPPLTQMLPPSIDTLTLRSSTDARIGGVFEQLFAGFVAARATAVPLLRNVVLEQDHGFNALTKLQMEETATACERNGVECRFSESAHAPWRRDFAQRFPRV